MVNGDLTRYPEVGCPRGARTGEPRAKAGARYCEPGWGPTVMGGTLRRSGPGGGPSHNKAPFYVRAHPLAHSDGGCHPSLWDPIPAHSILPRP